MLTDKNIVAAVSKINQRAERQNDVQTVIGTYVDVGLLPQLENRNHQIFYGRRGTGKTHVMKVLEKLLKDDNSNTVAYIDFRILGSTAQFSDPNIPVPQRCLALFRDFLLFIYNNLLEHICEYHSTRAEEGLTALDDLGKIITKPLHVLHAEKLTVNKQESTTTSSNTELLGKFNSLTPSSSLQTSVGRTTATTEAKQATFDVNTQEKIIFPDLLSKLKNVLELSETRLFVLADEWSSLPLDVQPYFAEFLKRGFLPLSSATLKISALEYRCHFNELRNGILTGFELGADIATAPDLDDYFVFDRNPRKVIEIYADILFRHLSAELPAAYLSNRLDIKTPEQFVSCMFTEPNTFKELARACEGVIRDLINIFTQAVFNAQRRGRVNIDRKAVLESSRSWFELDKARYLDDHLQSVLRRIVSEVIGKKNARSFLLPRELERHPVVQSLFDARVLHHMVRGYADKDNPGIRYNIYAIDYGAYVDLLSTSREPELDLRIERTDSEVMVPLLDSIIDRIESEVVVPFDDKRSIRRIVLDASVLA